MEVLEEDEPSTPVSVVFASGQGSSDGFGHGHDHGINTIVNIMHTLFDVFLVSGSKLELLNRYKTIIMF